MTPSPTSPYVLAFAELMEAKLEANRHKGNREGWMKASPNALLERLREELVELIWALRGTTLEPGPDALAAVAHEAADVANFAMMIADRIGALPLPAPWDPSACRHEGIGLPGCPTCDVRTKGEAICLRCWVKQHAEKCEGCDLWRWAEKELGVTP